MAHTTIEENPIFKFPRDVVFFLCWGTWGINIGKLIINSYLWTKRLFFQLQQNNSTNNYCNSIYILDRCKKNNIYLHLFMIIVLLYNLLVFTTHEQNCQHISSCWFILNPINRPHRSHFICCLIYL